MCEPSGAERLRMRPKRRARRFMMTTWEVKDLVAATPISGPACI